METLKLIKEKFNCVKEIDEKNFLFNLSNQY